MSLLSLSLLCVAASVAAQGSSSRLRVEYLDAPLTIDVATPRFSFAPIHPTRGASLASYRIVVAQVFPSAAPIWDSGVVAATSSLNIGESLAQPLRLRACARAYATHCMGRTRSATAFLPRTRMRTRVCGGSSPSPSLFLLSFTHPSPQLAFL